MVPENEKFVFKTTDSVFQKQMHQKKLKYIPPPIHPPFTKWSKSSAFSANLENSQTIEQRFYIQEFQDEVKVLSHQRHKLKKFKNEGFDTSASSIY